MFCKTLLTHLGIPGFVLPGCYCRLFVQSLLFYRPDCIVLGVLRAMLRCSADNHETSLTKLMIDADCVAKAACGIADFGGRGVLRAWLGGGRLCDVEWGEEGRRIP